MDTLGAHGPRCSLETSIALTLTFNLGASLRRLFSRSLSLRLSSADIDSVCGCVDDRVKTSRDGEKEGERERDKVQLCQHYSSSPSPLLCMSSTCHTDMMTSLQGSKKCAPARIIFKLCLRIDWMCGHGMHRNVDGGGGGGHTLRTSTAWTSTPIIIIIISHCR